VPLRETKRGRDELAKKRGKGKKEEKKPTHQV
jgi:hypothetical protein